MKKNQMMMKFNIYLKSLSLCEKRLYFFKKLLLGGIWKH